MAHVLKLLGILFMLSLFALPLTGCETAPWDSGMTLGVKVETPRDRTTVNSPTVTVSGRVFGTERAGAKVKVNETDVPVKDDKFSTSVMLTEGANVINVFAISTGGAKPSAKVNVAYARAQ